MMFKTLTVENFQSYNTQTIDFPEGVTLIRGENGAGKSTLLRAVFAGLFLTKMKRHTDKVSSLDKLVQTGEDHASVELTFEVGGEEYTVTWEIDVELDDDGERSASTDTCTLTATHYDSPVEGVTSVVDEIESLLDMTAKSFVNSVYVQQDDLTRLAAADADDRAEILDSLLGLDRVEAYIDRMETARPAAKAVEREAQNRQEELREQLDDIEPASELLARKNDLTTEIEDLEQKLDERREQRQQAKTVRDNATEKLDEYDSLTDEQDTLSDKLDSAREKRADLLDDISDANDAIEARQEDIADLNDELDALDDALPDEFDVTTAEGAADAQSTLTERVSNARSRLSGLNSDLEAEQRELERLNNNLEDAQQTLDAIEDEVETAEGNLEEAQNEVEDAEDCLSDVQERRNEQVAAVLDVTADAVTSDHQEDVDAKLETLRGTRSDRNGDLRAIDGKREPKTDRLDEIDGEERAAQREKAEAEYAAEQCEDRLTAARDEHAAAQDTLTDDHLAAVTEAANAIGDEYKPDTFGVAVDALDDLYATQTEKIQSALDTAYNEVGSAIAELEGDVTHLEGKLAEYDRIDSHGECPMCKQDVATSHTAHTDARQETQDELADVQETLTEKRQERESIDAQRDAVSDLREALSAAIKYRDGAVADKAATVEELEDTLNDHRERASDAADTLTDLRAERESLEQALADLDDEAEAIRDDLGDLDAEIEAVNKALGTFEAVENARQKLTEAEDAVSSAEEELDRKQQLAETAADDVDELQEQISEQEAVIDDVQADVEEAEETVETVEEYAATVDDAVETHDTIDEHRSTIDSKQTTIENANNRIDDVDDRINDLKGSLNDVEEKLGEKDRKELEDEQERAEDLIEKFDAKIEDLEDDAQSARDARTRVEETLGERERLESRLETLDERKRWGSDLYTELNEAIEAYQDAKAELRQENIALLNKYVNDLFTALYRNKSYEYVTIDDDYRIELVRTDGEVIEPEMSSGGEGALLNIALRAGVYRLIAQRDSDGGESLPPFILDEPTTFLDSGHISELDAFMQKMRDWNVSQVLVVSHEDGLIDTAENEFFVEKDDDNYSEVSVWESGSAGRTVGQSSDDPDADSSDGTQTDANLASDGGDVDE